jgi:hypothetical protein
VGVYPSIHLDVASPTTFNSPVAQLDLEPALKQLFNTLASYYLAAIKGKLEINFEENTGKCNSLTE